MTRSGVVLALLIGWYSIVGHQRVQDWAGEYPLWTRAVAVNPQSPLAHLNLAKALFGLGREADALAEVQRAADLEVGR